MRLLLMLHGRFLVVFLGLFAWGFWQPVFAFAVFGTLVALFELLLWVKRSQFRPSFRDGFCDVPSLSGLRWDNEEQSIIRQYGVFLLFPNGCQFQALRVDGIRWLSLLTWLPLLAWNGHWVLSAVVVVHVFLAGQLALMLNPLDYLDRAKNATFLREAAVLRQVMQRIWDAQEKKYGQSKAVDLPSGVTTSRRQQNEATGAPVTAPTSESPAEHDEDDEDDELDFEDEDEDDIDEDDDVGDDDDALDGDEELIDDDEEFAAGFSDEDGSEDAPGAETKGGALPPELVAALGALRDIAPQFDPIAFPLVAARVQQELVNEFNEFLQDIRGGTTLRQWLLREISIAVVELLHSGNFHNAPGVLNPLGPGAALMKIFDSALDEMVRLGTVDPAFAEREKARLRN